ncbi:hypothetical protein HDU78_002448 [Chytriomyces hyalinus]|nr:hypothetical protein HDU78_002448 [Chytriomyces hyalinus]
MTASDNPDASIAADGTKMDLPHLPPKDSETNKVPAAQPSDHEQDANVPSSIIFQNENSQEVEPPLILHHAMPLKPSIDTATLQTRHSTSLAPETPRESTSRPETPWGSHDLLAASVAKTPAAGTPTTCVHVAFQSKLGWMAWKDREASLFVLFERVFGCVSVVLKFTESLDVFGVEMEVPNDQVVRLEKELKTKYLLAEIDKIHGLSPAMKAPDCKVLRVSKTMGSGVSSDSIKSSLESLQARVNALRNCGNARKKEVDAISEQWNALREKVTGRCDKTGAHIVAKPEKLAQVEGHIVAKVMAELQSIQEW